MKLRFLCTQHRAWLEQDPGAAQRVWLCAWDTANELRAEGDWERAIRHAGAAVEAAVIDLQRSAGLEQRILNRFVDSCQLFLATLQELHHHGTARAFMGAAIQQLSDLVAAGAPRGQVLVACQRLASLDEAAACESSRVAASVPRSYHLH